MGITSKIMDFGWKVLQHILPAKPYLSLKYSVVFKKKINWDNPVSFSEKLQWIKLYGCRPEYTTMVDKFKVKEYVASKIGSEHIIPTIGVWDTPDSIDFTTLPDKFVLKCNHDSGKIIICHNKSELDVDAVRTTLKKMMAADYYLMGRETPYKTVKRRIIAEPLIEQADGGELKDYKVHNFNGEPKMILVCQNRFSPTGLTEDFYSESWELLPVRRPDHPNADLSAPKPEQLEELLNLSKILAADIPFVRTDFYIVGGRILFGEMTFFPSSGFVPFIPPVWDSIIGSWLTLPSKAV